MSSLRVTIVVLLASACAFAQTSSSLLQGTITDSSGAAVPNARVVATLANTDTNYSTTSNESGNYVLPNVRPGEYSISAEAPAFKRIVRTGVVVEVNQRARIDLILQVGEVKDSVQVSADVTNVDTYTSSINATVDSRRVVDLPLNGRQALQLQALLPGVVLAPTGQAASFIAVNTYLTFSINGTRPSASLYTLDGAINMDMYNNTPAAFPNPDAVQEFSIQTSNYTAVVGGTPGAAVNMVTKSGSNAFHGTLYEFLRNDQLNTRNFFAAGKPPLRKNQFGGNTGGPVIHNRTFFFAAYEANRERRGSTSSGNVVPTALERQGDFSLSRLSTGPVRDPLTSQPFPNNVIPTNRLDTVARNFAADYLPLPNLGTNLFGFNLSVPYTDDQFTGRLDHNFSDRSRLMLRYFYDDNSYIKNDALLDFNTTYDWATHNAAISHQFTFNPTTTNIATLTFNRNTFIRSPLATSKHQTWAELGCVSCVVLHPPSTPTDWNISITGGFGVRGGPAMLKYMQNFQFIDSFNKSIGNHLLTMGGGVLKARQNGMEYTNTSGTYSFDGTRSGSGSGYADYFLGLPISVTNNTVISATTNKWVPSAFFEDDWKASRKLTINLGVRWEPYLPLHEKRNRLTAFVPGQQSTLYPTAPKGLLFAGEPGVPDTVTSAEWLKLAPRAGFAFDPRGNGKTSIRGGYGIFSDTPRLVSYGSQLVRQPFSVGTVLSNPYSLTDPFRGAENIVSALLAYVGGVPAGTTSYQFLNPVTANNFHINGFTNGYAQQWNFNVQQQLVRDFVVTAAYVGTKGTHLQIPEEINGAPYIPGTCGTGPCSTSGNIDKRRIYQPFGLIESLESNGNSTYHALQVDLKKRFGRGYSILASYTYSKFIDMASDDGHGSTNSLATNPFNWFFDRGLSDNDLRHRFTSSFMWEVPAFRKAGGLKGSLLGGWQLNGILQLQCGSHFSVTAGTNRSLSGGAGDRADLIGAGSVAIYGDQSRAQFIAKYFDTSRFALPALGTFGTAGRNIMQGPGYANVDMSAFKSFRVSESKSLALRWEVFNLFNRANFGNPTGNFSSAVFGQITGAKDPRIMQVGLKFIF